MKILFLTPYPHDEAPSQRFRFEQYYELLVRQGIEFNRQSFLPEGKWRLFYSQGSAFQKARLLLQGFWKRLGMLVTLGQYNFVFIHREVAPVGPPVFEWLIAKVFRKKIIYDFDDAIWMTDKTNESKFEKMLRWRGKVSTICGLSYNVSCGNEYLCNYAKRFNKNVILNPTTLDTQRKHNPDLVKHPKAETLIIGWTGSHSTLKYLAQLEDVLQKIEKEYPQIHVVVIADRKPELNLSRVTFLPWAKETEASDLMKISIGVMPLPDDEWSKGKCGFKALQYMALEIPCIASPVGVNKTIIQHGINGYLAATEREWMTCLKTLLGSDSLRKQIGGEGRKTVVQKFSIASNQRNFFSLFE